MKTMNRFWKMGLGAWAAVATLALCAAMPARAAIVFSDDFEFPDVTVAQSGSTGNGGTSKIVDTSKWVRANQGYGASANGIEDEGAGRFTDPVGEQAYRFCYTNSGVTTAFGVIGSLTAGTTYTVSFDVVADSGATPYNMQFVTFNGAGTRNDVRSDSFVSKVLASRNGNAPGDGSYQTVSFEFTPDPVLHAAVMGHDLALRFKGATTSANIDNVRVSSVGPPPVDDPYADWAREAAFDGDKNGDGIPNGVAWVLGAVDPDEDVRENGRLPTLETDGDELIFAFRRLRDAEDDPNTEIKVEYSLDLDDWIDAVDGVDGIDIDVTPDGDFDIVEVRFPTAGIAADGRLFVRLRVERTAP